jgi:hypothetical protein
MQASKRFELDKNRAKIRRQDTAARVKRKEKTMLEQRA